MRFFYCSSLFSPSPNFPLHLPSSLLLTPLSYFPLSLFSLSLPPPLPPLFLLLPSFLLLSSLFPFLPFPFSPRYAHPFSQNPLCFSYLPAQNLHPTFHYILTLVFSCGIVLTMSLPDFDPAIHKETGNVPVVRWILGSQPENDLHGRHAAHPAGEASVCTVPRDPRCSDGMYDKTCALKRIFIKGG